MLPRITRIEISNFRGIRDLRIRAPKGEGLLIIGDNGTGKSSVVDAIEFFFTKEIHKLSGRLDVSPAECIPFAGAPPQDCCVAIEFENFPIPARTGFKHSGGQKLSANWVTLPAELKPLLDTAGKRAFILHRAQLTQFIESKPRDRFTRISDLIGIEFLDKTVEAWKAERGERQNILERVQQTFTGLSREIGALLGRPIGAEDGIRQAIASQVAPYGIDQVEDPAAIAAVQTQLAGKSSNSQNQVDAGKVQALIDKITETLTGWDAFLDQYTRLYAVRQDFLERAACLTEADFERIIYEGRRLIETRELDTCPVCEQPIERQALVSRLEQRQQELHTLVEARRQVDAQRDEALKALRKCLNPLQSLPYLFGAIDLPIPERLEDAWQLLEQTNLILNRSPLDLAPLDSFTDDGLLRAIFQDLAALQQRAKDTIAVLISSPSDQRINEVITLLSKMGGKWEAWRDAQQELKHADRVFKLVDHLYNQLVAARKQGIGEIVASLEKDFIRLYEMLHPGEGHKAIQIILLENRDQSADLRTETDGMKPMHPLGNYSEGHLDSLGLCIFLAFIKHFNKDVPLIVLDDVLTSIDAGHRMKVAQLIASEFQESQLVITTHDELWANELLNVLSKGGVPVRTIRMNPWSKETGATFDDYEAANWGYYKQQIAQGRKQDAIAGAGRNLEWFLSKMRYNLRLAIPATRDDRYTLGDLQPAFVKWVGKHPIHRPDESDFQQRLVNLVKELDVYWTFRNWSGAHYNEWGATISQEEAATFVSIIEELAQCFQCPACGNLVIYEKSQNLLRCPVCTPAELPKVTWEYDPTWSAKAERLLVNLSKIPDGETLLLERCQGAFEKLLRDSRRRLQLRIAPTDDDAYSAVELFEPYFDQLHKHPCTLADDWPARLSQIRHSLCGCFTPEYKWQPAKILAPKAIELMQTLRALTGLVSCPEHPDKLLTFTTVSGVYACSKCAQQAEPQRTAPAFWLVKE